MSKVRELNFGTRIDRKTYKLGICKRKPKRAWRGSSDLLQKFGDSLYSCATAEDTNLKFGMWTDLSEYYPENGKLSNRFAFWLA